MAYHSKMRMGNPHRDGGYIVPTHALECDLVVSIGIGEEISFDWDFAERGATIIQFDHTIKHPIEHHSNFNFINRGWGPRTDGMLLSFDDILSHLPAQFSKHALLKFDIEGAEYQALQTTRQEQLALFDTIICELHDLHRLEDSNFFERVSYAIMQLTANHVPVHLHANNCSELRLVRGVALPEVLEITLLRNDCDVFPDFSNEPIPGPLDKPCCPFRADISISSFGVPLWTEH